MSGDKKTLELQIRIAAQEALKAVESLKGEMRSLANEAKRISGDDGAALKGSFKEAEAAAKDTAAGIGDIKKAIGSLAEVAALTKALDVIKDMGAFALSTADTFQTARNQFGTLLGDMQAGAGLFNQIKAFNDKTPFSLDTLTQATNVLIAAKVPLSELQNELTKFGDLSQGNSQKFTSYINAFSKAAAKGKADMEVLNTYLNQGVPILDTLANKFGVTSSEMVEMVSQGKVGFQEFAGALKSLTAEGGQYFGGMELGSQSLAAMQEGLRESVNSLAASFGEMLLPAAIKIVEVLTAIANAINQSPLLKGVLIGALVMLTGYLAAMAVKAGIAFAAQMSLNFAIGALHPVVLASTIAVAALAAGYTTYAAINQQATREAENLAYAQRKQKDDTDAATASLEGYTNALKNMSEVNLDKNITLIEKDISAIEKTIQEIEAAYNNAMTNNRQGRANYWAGIIAGEKENLERARHNLEAAMDIRGNFRTSFIERMLAGSDAGKIQKINEQLAAARKYLTDPNLGNGEKSALHEIIKSLMDDLEKLTKKTGALSEIDRMAARWKEAWADVWSQFQAEQSPDPFAGVELERGKKLTDAYNNYVRDANKETIDQVNAYYDAKRSGIAEKLLNEEQRTRRELTATKIDDLEYEMREALKNIDTLEERRIIAAGESEEAIQEIRERYAAMRQETEDQYKTKITKTRLEEARASIVDWQTALSDSIVLALMDIEGFSDQAAVILADLAAQFADISFSAAISGFEEFGRALGEGKDAADSLQQALAAMAQQILKQLPMMFLQAGLQLIANGQWALGLGFIAAAGSSAIIAGYVDGATKNAKGGVYDEYGKAARAFAEGGTFTNQIVTRPTYFRYGGGIGLMGEAGPEAIVPLKRMADGSLGVEAGSGGGSQVIINIINNTGAEVSQEETADAAGNKQLDVIIGSMVNNHIASGKADRVIGARYNLRAAGV